MSFLLSDLNLGTQHGGPHYRAVEAAGRRGQGSRSGEPSRVSRAERRASPRAVEGGGAGIGFTPSGGGGRSGEGRGQRWAGRSTGGVRRPRWWCDVSGRRDGAECPPSGVVGGRGRRVGRTGCRVGLRASLAAGPNRRRAGGRVGQHRLRLRRRGAKPEDRARTVQGHLRALEGETCRYTF
jgi:hypothetical protein